MAQALDVCRGAHIHIISDAASTDAAQMSKGLVAAFNSAAWNVRTPTVVGLSDPPTSGIGLKVTNPLQLCREEHCVANALKFAGLEFDLQVGGASLPIPGEKAVQLILTTSLRD